MATPDGYHRRQRWRRTAGLCAGVALAVSLVAACTRHAGRALPTSISTTVVGSPTTATLSTAPIAGADPLTCTGAIGYLDRPDRPEPEMQSVFDVVALNTNRTLQAPPSGQSDPRYAYFAKSPLEIRVGQPFELIVPLAWRRRVAFSWGNSGPQPTMHLQVTGCPYTTEHKDWLVYAGGFFVAKPACVPLIVKTDRHTKTIHIAVGAPCPATNGG